MAAVTTTATSALEDFIGSGSGAFLKFDESGEPIEGIYKGCEMEDDPFKPGEPRMVYSLEVDGQPRTLASGSKRLAKALLKKNPKVGDYIKITRSGSGFDTDYEVEVSKDGMPF